MGITLKSIDIWLKNISREKNIDKSSTIITIGRQSVYFGIEEVKKVAQRHSNSLAEISDSEVIKIPASSLITFARRNTFINDITLFRLLGFTEKNIYSVDYSSFEGAKIKFDLNTLWKGEKYDFIFDEGTGEHIFSQLHYFNNISNMLNIGGIYFFSLPVNNVNHGFYNYSSHVFTDYFRNNGFQQIYLKWIYSGEWPSSIFEYYLELDSKIDYITVPIFSCGLVGIFKKTRNIKPNIPNQSFYESLWDSENNGTIWKPQYLSKLQKGKNKFMAKCPVIYSGFSAIINMIRLFKKATKCKL